MWASSKMSFHFPYKTASQKHATGQAGDRTKELSVPQQVVPSCCLLLLLFCFCCCCCFFLAMMAHQVWGDAGGYYTIKSG
jgi:hypothetical protein